MVSTAKKDLILDGLDCANCSAKIEYEVNKIDGVVASMNFITKTLSVEIENEHNIDDLLKQINAIINKHEPHVIVKEKTTNKLKKKSLLLNGLDCANCATKIEIKVNNITGVKSANVDFISKKLVIELENNRDLKDILNETESIVKRLEPDVEIIDADDHKNSEVHHHGEHNNKKELAKLGVGGVLFAIGLIFNFPNWINFSIFIASYIIVGGEIVFKAFKNVIKGQIFDENFLMTIATIGAFLIGEFPEAVAVMLFYNIGEFFQDMAVDRSRKSISELMNIRPDYANLRINGDIKQVAPEEVSIGDIIIVKPGEKIPLDGTIIEGYSTIDTSALTGESVPREVSPSNDVLSGFININGVLTVKVTKDFGESTVSKILDLVQNASSKKAPTENFITKFARYYTPIVVIIATLIAILPPLLTGADFSDWIYRALVFLVISCPCALVVSIPLGFFGGIGRASKSGILIKGSNYLEALNSVETVVFDKTGTLTKGVFTVTEINNMNNYSKDELLQYAAYAEVLSNHPIATSILKSYNLEIDNDKIENYEEIPGFGVKVRFEDKDILAGNSKLMDKEKIKYSHVESIGTIVHVSVNNNYAGYILISDEIKEDSFDAINALKSVGVKRTIMLTGDSKIVGDSVGKLVGIDEVFSELLPTDKVEKLEFIDKQKSPNKKLIFVGDGINDAPVLARADIGIAMGGLGSDAAIEAADIVIMTDEPTKISTAIKIAKRTRKIVWQNIIVAMSVKLIFLVLGAFGVATLWEAVFADVGVALLAVLNAMRVMREERL